MGINLIYPTINLIQYNLREGLGDRQDKTVDRARSFYSKFLPDLSDNQLKEYRNREDDNREFNQLAPSVWLRLPNNLDGFYYPVQMGEVKDEGRYLYSELNFCS